MFSWSEIVGSRHFGSSARLRQEGRGAQSKKTRSRHPFRVNGLLACGFGGCRAQQRRVVQSDGAFRNQRTGAGSAIHAARGKPFEGHRTGFRKGLPPGPTRNRCSAPSTEGRRFTKALRQDGNAAMDGRTPKGWAARGLRARVAPLRRSRPSCPDTGVVMVNDSQWRLIRAPSNPRRTNTRMASILEGRCMSSWMGEVDQKRAAQAPPKLS